MPPRKTRGKKRKTKGKKKSYYKKRRGVYTLADRFLEGARKRGRSALKGAKKRGSAAARYAYKNPGKIAEAGAGAAGLGLAGYEGYLAARRGLDPYSDLPGPDRFASPTAAAFRRGRRGVTAMRDYFTNPNRDMRGDISGGVYSAAESADGFVRKIPQSGSALLDRMFPGRVTKREKRKIDEQRRAYNAADGTLPGDNIGSPYGYGYGKRRRRSSYKFGAKKEGCGHTGYGKRRRRKSRCGSFGKKAKKPSAALKRMCKKHKVRLTLKRGGKRVYKSEALLKKQCKKAMKRKSKK